MSDGEDLPIIRRLGGAPAVARKLAAAGFTVGESLVRNWRSRGRIPTDGILRLWLLAEREGLAVSWRDFVTVTEREAMECSTDRSS